MAASQGPPLLPAVGGRRGEEGRGDEGPAGRTTQGDTKAWESGTNDRPRVFTPLSRLFSALCQPRPFFTSLGGHEPPQAGPPQQAHAPSGRRLRGRHPSRVSSLVPPRPPPRPARPRRPRPRAADGGLSGLPRLRPARRRGTPGASRAIRSPLSTASVRWRRSSRSPGTGRRTTRDGPLRRASSGCARAISCSRRRSRSTSTCRTPRSCRRRSAPRCAPRGISRARPAMPTVCRRRRGLAAAGEEPGADGGGEPAGRPGAASPAPCGRGWRRRTARRGRGAAPGKALARALVLGDVSGLPLAWMRGLRVAGVYHLMSVSGVHLALVAGLVWLLGFRLPRPLRLLLMLASILLYLLLVGPLPALLRSAVMARPGRAGAARRAPPAAANALGWAVILLLLDRPDLVLSPGFQLTVVGHRGDPPPRPARSPARWQERASPPASRTAPPPARQPTSRPSRGPAALPPVSLLAPLAQRVGRALDRGRPGRLAAVDRRRPGLPGARLPPAACARPLAAPSPGRRGRRPGSGCRSPSRSPPGRPG